MKRVVFFIASIDASGGTERVCITIANKLAELGFVVSIISFYGGTPFFDVNPQINIIPLFKHKKNFKLILPIVLYKLRVAVLKFKADILINADSALFVYSLPAMLGLKVKNVVWEHFTFNVSLNKSIRAISRKLAVKYSDAVITLTEKDKKNWQKNLVCRVPVISINNPIPFSVTELINTNKENIVLSAGRLSYEKGFDRLLEVWKIVKDKDVLNWKLHIVGSGELKEDLENQIVTLGLQSSVKLIPVTKDIQMHYSQSSIYCMTSRFEGFGLVLLEAQTFGLPLVSYDCEAGPSEIIKNGENGFLIENGDSNAMAAALNALMVNPNLREEMGSKSLQNSVNFEIDKIIQSWVSLFDLVLVAK